MSNIRKKLKAALLMDWYTSAGCDDTIYIKEYNPSLFNEAPINDNKNRDLLHTINTLDELRDLVMQFEECELKKCALNTVFGGGKTESIMLIGEAPGATEDEMGIPFCGQSGKLLDNIIKSIGYKRNEVYVTNTVFWRPPLNRRPTPEEIELCRPFVEKHIALVKPKLIILVGATAVESLLKQQSPINQLRRRMLRYRNEFLTQDIKLCVIFHPAYLLRQQTQKKTMWLDMRFISRNMSNNEADEH